MWPATRPSSSPTRDKIALPFRRSPSTRSASAERPKARSLTTRIARMSSGFSGRTVIFFSLFRIYLILVWRSFAVDFVGAIRQTQRALARRLAA